MTPGLRELQAMLDYDRETGVFTWRTDRSSNAKAGDVAGYLDRGRVKIRVGDKQLLAHRLAWLFVTGEWPTRHIDHFNGNPSDNKFKNLRDVSHAVNLQNQRRARSDNRSGLLGVQIKKGRFTAVIRIAGTAKFLGAFDSAEEAHEVYLAAKRQMHEGCSL